MNLRWAIDDRTTPSEHDASVLALSDHARIYSERHSEKGDINAWVGSLIYLVVEASVARQGQGTTGSTDAGESHKTVTWPSHSRPAIYSYKRNDSTNKGSLRRGRSFAGGLRLVHGAEYIVRQ